MNVDRFFKSLVVTSVVLIYLIIIAGAVVRMTGSGMGCPDWPKCFGYYIPPTEVEQILWKPQTTYEEGVIVIKDEGLLIAKKDFTSTSKFLDSNWNPYTKHDYAKFNVWHTWIEYINRLVTVLSGIPILLLFLLSFRYIKSNIRITVFAVLTIIAMAFQAWLGKIVVDSNLMPWRITVHMVVAFLIVAILLYILYLTKDQLKKTSITSGFKALLIFAVILTLIQVALGTQVRQYVDEQIKILGENQKSQWLQPPTFTFYVHRSFSILVTLVSLLLFWLHKKNGYKLFKLNWVLLIIALEVVTGIFMYYFDFPFLTQPLHLVFASILFGIQFYLLLEVFHPLNKGIESQ